MFAEFISIFALLGLVYQTTAESKDILRFYRPKPDQPQELNEFLTNVHRHKKDFAFIRDYVEKQKNYEENLKDTHDLFSENSDYGETDTAPLVNRKHLDPVPTNDIYPFVYRNNLNDKYPNGRYSRYLHSPIRLRRDLVSNNGPESQKLKKNQVSTNNKRGVQINIKDYGQVPDKADNDYGEPNSIVLNIEPVDDQTLNSKFDANPSLDQTIQEKRIDTLPFGNMVPEEPSPLSNRLNFPQNPAPQNDKSRPFQMVRQIGFVAKSVDGENKKTGFDRVQGVILNGGNKETVKKREYLDNFEPSNKMVQQDNEFLHLQPISVDITTTLDYLEPMDNYPLYSEVQDPHLHLNLKSEDPQQNHKLILHPNNKHVNLQKDLPNSILLRDEIRERMLKEDQELEAYDDNYDENDVEEVEIRPSRLFDVNANKYMEEIDKVENKKGINNGKKVLIIKHQRPFNELIRRPRKGAHVRKGKKKNGKHHQRKKFKDEKPKKKSNFGDAEKNPAFDFIPAFQKRSLKAVESMYDAYLGDFGQEDVEEKKIENDKFGDLEDYDSEVDDDEDYNYVELRSSNNHNLDGEVIHDQIQSFDRDKIKKVPKKFSPKPIDINSSKSKPNAGKIKTKPAEISDSIQSDIFLDVKDQDFSNLARGRGKSKKRVKGLGKRVPKRPADVNPSDITKPLKDEEKKELFLKFNPSFQRWPRFVLDDEKYRELSRRNAWKNRRFVNKYVPLGNNYFVKEPVNERVGRMVADGGKSLNDERKFEEDNEDVRAQAQEEIVVEKREGKKNISKTAKQSSAVASLDHDLDNNVTIDPNIIAGATFPVAVQDVLSNVSEDILEGGPEAEIEKQSTADSRQVTTAGRSTYQFPTDSQYDEESECVTQPVRLTSICADHDSGQSTTTLTTMLALMNESSYSVNQSKAEYLDLNDILGGNLPKQIVNEIWTEARRSVRKGLRAGPFNLNLELSRYNSSAETNTILNEMTKLMLQLEHSASCQQLPNSLKNYVSEITRNPKDDVLNKLKEMNDIDFDDYQGAYMFHADQRDSLQSKVEVLKTLLNNYNNLPADCKERAEPVKDYIEKHLGLVNNLLEGGKSQHKSKKHHEFYEKQKYLEGKRDARMEEDLLREKLVKKQLEDVGLGEGGHFSPMFNIDELVESNKNNTRSKVRSSTARPKREINTPTSPQYGKLADAVRRLSREKERQQRIREMYGRKIVADDDGDREDKRFDSALAFDSY